MDFPLGRQWIVELYGCDAAQLKKAHIVEEVMVSAAHLIKATVVTTSFHEFSPFGVSGMVVIAESHLAIHTWPEFGYAAVDVFTCGSTLMPEPAVEYIAREFQAAKNEILEFRRGYIDGPQSFLPKTIALDQSKIKQSADAHLFPSLQSLKAGIRQ